MGLFNRKKKTKEGIDPQKTMEAFTVSAQLADLKRKIDATPQADLDSARSLFDLDTLEEAKALIFIMTIKEAENCHEDTAVKLLKSGYRFSDAQANKIVSRLW